MDEEIGGTKEGPQATSKPGCGHVAFRHYQDGDDEPLNNLFNEVFGSSRTLEQFMWKFKEAPEGFHPRLFAVACDADKIVGQILAVPLRFKLRDSEVMVWQTCDHSVHNEYRGGPVFYDLFYFAVIPYHTEAAFSYGFPNRINRVFGVRFLKYIDCGKVPVLTKRLSLRAAVAKRTGNRLLANMAHVVSGQIYRAINVLQGVLCNRSLRVDQAELFDERVDELWKRVSPAFAIAQVRSARFLNWRYRKPGQQYVRFVCSRNGVLAGYIVLRVLEAGNVRVGLVVDLIADDPERVGRLLIRRAVQWALAQDLDFLDCWMVPTAPYHRVVTSMGFKQRPSDVSLIIRKFNTAVPLDFLTDINNWYVSIGDSDEA